MLIMVGLLAMACSTAAYAGWGITFQTNPAEPLSGSQVSMVSMSGYTDGKDEVEVPLTLDYDMPRAKLRIYQENGVAGWDYLDGWYAEDYRPQVDDGGDVIFGRMYVWANPSYTADTIQLAYYWFIGQAQPSLWQFSLRLINAPPEAGYTGPTTWEIPASAGKTNALVLMQLPVHRTTDAVTGYEFEFRGHMVPEPTVLVSLASMIGCAVLLRRR